MAKLPERQLRGVRSGFDDGPIRSAILQEGKMCAGVDQRGAPLQGRIVIGARHALNKRNHCGVGFAVVPIPLARQETDR